MLNSSATLSAAVLIPCNLIGMTTAGLSGVYLKKKGCTKFLMLLMAGAGFTGTLLYISAMFITSYSAIILSTSVIGIGAASILGGMEFSADMIKGVAFSLATTSFYGVLLLVLTISGYKERRKCNH